MNGTIDCGATFERIFAQHPEAPEQLDSVAVVTGCFDTFDALAGHLRDVRTSITKYASPRSFRVLEHNVCTPEQFEIVSGELGYEVFITLECFDQEKRKVALNGNVGRKGRDSRQFLEMIRTYAEFLDARRDPMNRLVRVTYLIGIDSLETVEDLFRQLAELNRSLDYAKVVPWLSVFTPYASSMRTIQHPDFSMTFLLEAMELATKYFGQDLIEAESGTTADGYARGLF
jgi:hypothetical protein